MHRASLILLFLVASTLAVQPACVRKAIGIRSDPPGAVAYLDGLEVGRTPVDYIPFDFYGTREIKLYKDGYLVEARTVEIRAPWYEYFPIDIVPDLLLPWVIRDHRQFYFQLRPAELIDNDTLVRHAEETRSLARSRIEAGRLAARHRPRAYVYQGSEKEFFLWGPFTSPPRTEPVYSPLKEPATAPKSEGGK